MLRGGTIIIMSARPQRFPMAGAVPFLGFGREEVGEFGGVEDDLLSRALESGSVFGRPSWCAPLSLYLLSTLQATHAAGSCTCGGAASDARLSRHLSQHLL